MYPIRRSIGIPATILGLGLPEFKVMACVYGLGSVVAGRFSVLVGVLCLFLGIALKVAQKNKPRGYWGAWLLFFVEQGIWVRDRDQFQVGMGLK